jgi:hypothetical protein
MQPWPASLVPFGAPPTALHFHPPPKSPAAPLPCVPSAPLLGWGASRRSCGPVRVRPVSALAPCPVVRALRGGPVAPCPGPCFLIVPGGRHCLKLRALYTSEFQRFRYGRGSFVILGCGSGYRSGTVCSSPPIASSSGPRFGFIGVNLRWRMQRDICTGSLEQRPRHFDLGRQVNPITLGGASLYSESLGRESAGMVIVISSRRERIPSLA